MRLQTEINAWLDLPEKQFSRNAVLDGHQIACDCSGLISLLCDRLTVPKPYGLESPRAVHYFAILQEIGSNHISQLKPWNLLAWRKDNVPKTGDSGHVLLVAGEPERVDDTTYRLSVIDATRAHNGLARREICLHTNLKGHLIGVQLQLSKTKVKRTSIYHTPLLSKRYCLGCGLPLKLCLCKQVQVSGSDPSIVILRHPDERRKTLSTVSLIKQRYPGVLVKEGEVFNPIRRPNLALVFPDFDSDIDFSGNKRIAYEPTAPGSQPELTTPVMLDATWRKSKRMLHDNDWLRELPLISIAPRSTSNYLLRKVPGPNSLSTVEAFALLQEDLDLQKLLTLFMQKQIEVMGKDIYESNYRDFINYTPP